MVDATEVVAKLKRMALFYSAFGAVSPPVVDAAIECLGRLIKENAGMAQQIENLEHDTARLRRLKDDPWHWQGDGHDDLDTLSCPVLIEPEKLKALLDENAKLRERCETLEVFLREALARFAHPVSIGGIDSHRKGTASVKFLRDAYAALQPDDASGEG